jgi:probable rRNA maturation factor
MTNRPPGRPPRRRTGPDDGLPTVFVADERGPAGPADPDVPSLDVSRWATLAEAVLIAEGVRGDAEVSVLFIDEDEIARLNIQFMGVDGPTDVLSFPIDGDLAEPGRWPDGGTNGPDRVPVEEGDLPLLLGDIVISPAVALANAPTHAGTFDDEIALLVVHGLLHILGMDHATDDERDAMQRRERELLAELHGALAADPWASVNGASVNGAPVDEPLGGPRGSEFGSA